jgi:hypothetical protein
MKCASKKHTIVSHYHSYAFSLIFRIITICKICFTVMQVWGNGGGGVEYNNHCRKDISLLKEKLKIFISIYTDLENFIKKFVDNTINSPLITELFLVSQR